MFAHMRDLHVGGWEFGEFRWFWGLGGLGVWMFARFLGEYAQRDPLICCPFSSLSANARSEDVTSYPYFILSPYRVALRFPFCYSLLVLIYVALGAWAVQNRRRGQR